jgi:hypothetical protein
MALVLVGIHVYADDSAGQPQADVAGTMLGDPAADVGRVDPAPVPAGVPLGRGRLLARRQRQRPVAGGEVGFRGAAVRPGAHAAASGSGWV